ncbi:hypothetical protein [Mycobacterium sp.]|uniref:hypothetical protein n=1 Tax=Mycobacterium sp. TaxID=1785 RepID=UPI0031CF1CAE
MELSGDNFAEVLHARRRAQLKQLEQPGSVALFGEIVTFLEGRGEARHRAGPDDMVEVGDRVVPRRITAAIYGDHNTPDVALVIEVRQGVPACAEVRVIARDGAPEVRRTHLKAIPLAEWVDAAVAACSWIPARGGILYDGFAADRAKARRNATRVRAGQPRASTHHLQKVADIYREHLAEHPTEAVRRAFGYSPRTAARYVERARAAGLLPPTTRGKKRA